MRTCVSVANRTLVGILYVTPACCFCATTVFILIRISSIIQELDKNKRLRERYVNAYFHVVSLPRVYLRRGEI